jgi:hypothetical protein
MEHTHADKLKFIEVFRSNATDVSRACKAFKIARKTFYAWYNDGADSRFREAVDEAREEIKDFAESQLLTLMKGIPKLDDTGKIVGWISRPDTAAIIFFNKTRNKDRGYVERLEVRNRNEEPASIDMSKLTAEQRQQLYGLLDIAAPDE